jgi:hypothetical protein
MIADQLSKQQAKEIQQAVPESLTRTQRYKQANKPLTWTLRRWLITSLRSKKKKVDRLNKTIKSLKMIFQCWQD